MAPVAVATAAMAQQQAELSVMVDRLFAFAAKNPSDYLSLDSDILALVAHLKRTPREGWSPDNHSEIREYYRYVCVLDDPTLSLRQMGRSCKVGEIVSWMGKNDGVVYSGRVLKKHEYDDIRVVPAGIETEIRIHMSQLVEYEPVGKPIDSKAVEAVVASVKQISITAAAPPSLIRECPKTPQKSGTPPPGGAIVPISEWELV